MPAHPAAVSALSAALVAGAPVPGRVLGTFASRGAAGVYVGLTPTSCLPLLSPDALRLPTAVIAASGIREVVAAVRPGEPVTVGGGGVAIGDHRFELRRTWSPQTVHSACGPGTTPTSGTIPSRSMAPAPGTTPSPSMTSAPESRSAASTPVEVQSAVAALVGLGPGLTPSGDDALCGALLTLRACGHSTAADLLAAAVEARLERTSAISATLLRCAAAGFAVPQVVALVRAVAATRALPPAGSPMLDSVLAIGHTSGADLVTGIAGALAAMARPDGRTAEGPHTLENLVTARRSA